MYVIFPADEVVYLSYGRLIYVPLSPSPDSRANIPIRTTSLEATEIVSNPAVPSTSTDSGKNKKPSVSESHCNPKPGPSNIGSLERPKTREKKSEQNLNLNGNKSSKSKPVNPQKLLPDFYGSLERPTRIRGKTPERAFNSNSNKSSKSSKYSSSSSKSRSQPSGSREKVETEPTTSQTHIRDRTSSDSINAKPQKTNKFRSSSFRSFLRPSSSRDKTPEPTPVRPDRKKDKKASKVVTPKPKSPVAEKKPSYFDLPTVLREKIEIPRSEIINTRSDQIQTVKVEKPIKREKSPVIKFFRAKSASPRNSPRDRHSVDFDYLFKRDASPGKLSVHSVPQLKQGEGSGTNLAGQQNSPSSEKSSPTKKRAFFSNPRTKRAQEIEAKMAGNESPLRDLIHPAYNEHLKTHNAVTFKLVRTVSDFTQQLGQMYEQHAEELQMLVANFRKRNGELRKERPACPSSLFHTWETLLQEVEIDSQALGDIASILGRQVSRPLLERSFHRKIQSRKVFTQRESYETIIAKTEEKLAKCRQEYKNAYLSYLAAPSTESLSAYFNTHNAYIQQLHATNGMMEEYGKCTLPSLLQELEEIYSDLCSTVTDAVLQGAEVVSSRAMEQCRRYEGLVSQCKAVSGPSDLTHLARALPTPTGRGPVMKRIFVPPQPPPPPDPVDGEPQDLQVNDNIPPPLKDELVIDRLSAVQIKPSHDVLRKEAQDLDAQIRQIQDALDTLLRIQQRSVEASLYNKANELQEDISMKRFDLRVAQLHLSAINRQKELFSSKLEGEMAGRERKMSSASTGSMKNKWLKAFKSLKTPPPEPEKKNQMYHAVSTIIAMRKNGSAATRELLKGDPDAHNFQEYTYKKITPCDVCSQVLRGHTRQGLKCRICKMNVHLDCQDKASKCQTKARLLRRQKSTSEIETRVPETNIEDEKSPEVDQIYQVLKQATEISNSKPRVNVEIIPPSDKSATGSNPGSSGSSGQSLNRRGVPPQPSRATGSMLAVVNPAPCSTSSDNRQGPSVNTETSSMRRRLFAGMKSLTGFGSRSRHGSPGHRSISLPERTSMTSSTSAVNICPMLRTNNVAPHSPRRQKLNLRMKSLSLDSPESTEHVRRGKHHGVITASDPHSNQSSSSRIQFSNVPPRPVQNHVTRSDLKAKSTPSSPVHNRRLLSAKNIRMSSVELPDDNEKSPSSASTSPCPSPVGGKKSHRLLPTNLYVVLYNFKSRHQDELDLKAGYKVTVIDTSDPDWWKGKCLGKVGFFPSKYVSKLSSGEKPLQVTHNLQVSDGDNGLMLLRDQIVIQIGEELDGMVMIRSGDNRQGVCPVKFLQEV
ncbi:uncharacterized protein LOC108908470 [Anoplophora glabripennis]|uniref:uncharacterized protein LOC108908470 n=1 Tax=Anoplophora glabripennis TaxID=217634 RepID=UPI0008759563|nr:uncharacterized protein LOC108908470 [Anoplophora glabripennis]